MKNFLRKNIKLGEITKMTKSEKKIKGARIINYPVKRYRAFKRPSGSRYLLLRKALVEAIGVCYWCDIPVKEYNQDGQGLPDDAATIDHLYPRQDRRKYQITEKVLACNKCNQERNVERQRAKNKGNDVVATDKEVK